MLFAFIGSLLIAPSAQAHTVLISSKPALNEVVKELPATVQLTFADSLLQIKGKEINSVLVVDPMGMNIVSGNAEVKGAILTAALHPSMVMDGNYQVNFRVVAQDGHVVLGKYTFSVGSAAKAMDTSTKMNYLHSGIYNLKVASQPGLAPGGDPKASFSGTLVVDLAKNQVCYKIIAKGVSNIVAMHLHPLMEGAMHNMTINDEVFVLLSNLSINSKNPVCTKASNQNLNLLVSNPTHFAVMIHTKQYPDGAVAGRLAKA
jgi:methionine-rich copper-binding protein CopC